MKLYYLYKIVNQINGKLYIGITSDPKRRKAKHFSQPKQENFTVIRAAMDKHGRENFEFEILCIGEKDYILDLEVKTIELYQTRNKKFGYNIKPGGESGRGYAVRSSKRDTPVYVSGFWFPVRRVALKALNMSKNVYKNRQRNKTLGDEVRGKKDIIYVREEIYNPVFVGDFWFPNRKVASLKLNLSYGTVSNRINIGFIGNKKRQREQTGVNNNFFGISAKDHNSSVPVIINNVKFDCLKHAVEATGYSKYIIHKRIKENHPDFQYA